MNDRLFRWLTFAGFFLPLLGLFAYLLLHPEPRCGRFCGSRARHEWIAACAEHRPYEQCAADADKLGCK